MANMGQRKYQLLGILLVLLGYLWLTSFPDNNNVESLSNNQSSSEFPTFPLCQKIVTQIEIQPIFSPIKFVIQNGEVSFEAELEIVTPLGSIGLEPNFTVAQFFDNVETHCLPFVVIIQDDSKPEGQNIQLYHVNLIETDVELILNEATISRIYIDRDGMWVGKTQTSPFINYNSRSVWIDATGRDVTLTLRPVKGMWHGSSYQPWSHYKKAEIRNDEASKLLLAASTDITKIMMLYVPQWCSYHINPSIGKIADLIFKVFMFVALTVAIFSFVRNDNQRVWILAILLVLTFFWVLFVLSGAIERLLVL